jgi:hypothetical protein
MEEKFPKKVGRKPTKEKREETTNKENILGIQTTIEKYLVAGSRNTKNIGVNAPS